MIGALPRQVRKSQAAPGHRPTAALALVRTVAAILFVAMLVLLAAAGAPARAQPQAQTAALPTGGALPMVVDARLGVHPDKTRFVLDLTDGSAFRVSAEGAPWRVVVDLPEVAFAPKVLPPGRGHVTAIRQEPGSGGGIRLVLETTGPVKLAWVAMIPPQDGRPPRFVLDITPTEPAAFRPHRQEGGIVPAALAVTAAPAVAPVPPPRAPSSAELGRRVVPAALSGMGAAVPVPMPKPPVAEKPLIVIDPGHGGQDPGAIAVNGMHEKEITLSVARELKAQLEATGRYRVALTRDKDVFIRLRDRVAKARGWGADLFISLHADSIGRKGVRGLSVYTLSDKASDREAEMLAQRENRADSVAGLDLSGEADEVVSILIDLAQRDTRNQSLRLASFIVKEAAMGDVALLTRPQRSAGFAVLTAPDVPSVLVELGYLSDPRDAQLLASGAHRKRLARSMVRAVDGYFSDAILLSRS